MMVGKEDLRVAAKGRVSRGRSHVAWDTTLVEEIKEVKWFYSEGLWGSLGPKTLEINCNPFRVTVFPLPPALPNFLVSVEAFINGKALSAYISPTPCGQDDSQSEGPIGFCSELE